MKMDLKMMDFKDGKREKKIIKTAFIGIITNFFLAGAKIFIAMVSNSVALISQMLSITLAMQAQVSSRYLAQS